MQSVWRLRGLRAQILKRRPGLLSSPLAKGSQLLHQPPRRAVRPLPTAPGQRCWSLAKWRFFRGRSSSLVTAAGSPSPGASCRSAPGSSCKTRGMACIAPAQPCSSLKLARNKKSLVNEKRRTPSTRAGRREPAKRYAGHLRRGTQSDSQSRPRNQNRTPPSRSLRNEFAPV